MIVKDADSISTIHEREVKNVLVDMGHDIPLMKRNLIPANTNRS